MKPADLHRSALDLSARSAELGSRLAVSGNLPLAYAVLAVGAGCLSLATMQITMGPATARRRGGHRGRS